MFNFLKKTKPINNAVTIVVKAEEQVKEVEKPPEVKYTKQTVYSLHYLLSYSEGTVCKSYTNIYTTKDYKDYIKMMEHINDTTKENHNILTLNGGKYTCLNIGIEREDLIVIQTDSFISLRYLNDETTTLVPIECSPQI